MYVHERLMLVRLMRFMECSGGILTTQFSYSKGLGTDNVILYVSHLPE